MGYNSVADNTGLLSFSCYCLRNTRCREIPREFDLI